MKHVGDKLIIINWHGLLCVEQVVEMMFSLHAFFFFSFYHHQSCLPYKTLHSGLFLYCRAKAFFVLGIYSFWMRNCSKYPSFNTILKLMPHLLKIITKYPSDSITYIIIGGGNYLSYQKHVQVIDELASYSITIKKFGYLFLL